MDQFPAHNRPHYHIHWKNKETLDWECFHTYSEAKMRAEDLALPREEFTIEEVSSDCPMRRAMSASAEQADTLD